MNDGTGWLTKPLMFLSSYAPLFALLAIRFESLYLVISCLALALLGVASVWLLLREPQRATGSRRHRHKLKSADIAGTEASAYLAGYLLPFLTVAEPGRRDLVAYGVFLVVAGVVHARTGIIQVNPTLFVLGWTVLRVTDERGFSGFMLSRDRAREGDTVYATRLTNDVLVCRSIERLTAAGHERT